MCVQESWVERMGSLMGKPHSPETQCVCEGCTGRRGYCIQLSKAQCIQVGRKEGLQYTAEQGARFSSSLWERSLGYKYLGWVEPR